jgi:hypothetical protein
VEVQAAWAFVAAARKCSVLELNTNVRLPTVQRLRFLDDIGPEPACQKIEKILLVGLCQLAFVGAIADDLHESVPLRTRYREARADGFHRPTDIEARPTRRLAQRVDDELTLANLTVLCMSSEQMSEFGMACNPRKRSSDEPGNGVITVYARIKRFRGHSGLNSERDKYLQHYRKKSAGRAGATNRIRWQAILFEVAGRTISRPRVDSTTAGIVSI